MARGLSCSEADGIFLDQGSNLCLLGGQVDPSALSHQGCPHGHFSTSSFIAFKFDLLLAALDVQFLKFFKFRLPLGGDPICVSVCVYFPRLMLLPTTQLPGSTSVFKKKLLFIYLTAPGLSCSTWDLVP